MSIENIITPWDTLEKRKRMLKFDINSTLKEATTEDFSLIGRQPEPNDGILHFTSDRFITLNGMIYGTGGGFYDLNPLYEKMNGKNIETDEEADEFVASYGDYEFLPYVHYHINSSAYTLTTFMGPSSVFQIKNAYDGSQYYRVYSKYNLSNPWTPVKLKWDTNSNKYIINKFENSSIATLSDPIPMATNASDGLMSSDHVNSLSSLDTKFNTHAAAITKLETEQSKQSSLLNNLNTSVNSINSNISGINTKISTVTNNLNNLKISYNKLYNFTINRLSYIETWISDFQTARPTTLLPTNLPPSVTHTPTASYDLCIYVNNNAYIDNNDSNIAYLSNTNTGSMKISNNLNGSVILDLSNKDNYEIIGEQPTQYLKFQCKSNSLDFDAFMYTRFSGIITLNQGNLWVSSVMLYNGNNISAITTPPNTHVLKEANYISFDKIFSIIGDTKVAYIDLELTTALPSGSTLAPTTTPSAR